MQGQVIVQENSELQVMERIHEQIVETTKEVPQERVQQRTVEQVVHVPIPQIQEQEIPQVVDRIQEQIDEPIEVPPQEHVQALSVLENVLHDRQHRFNRCVQVLKREKGRLRVLEERGVVPPHELQSLRSHIQIKRRRFCESILADGMTGFHKSVDVGNHFPTERI